MNQNSSNEQASSLSTKLERIAIEPADLPLHCPTAVSTLWNSHPQVYLPIEDSGEAKCPYCGAEYILIKK